MGLSHLEPFIDQTVATLRAELPIRIDALNGETSDFDLEKPADDAYVPGGVDTILTVPLVEVAAPDWDISNPDIGQHAFDADYTLMVRLWYQHPDYNVLYRSLMRYGRCLVEVLGKHDALGGGAVVERMRGSYRVNPETNENIGFEGGALIVIMFSTVELVP